MPKKQLLRLDYVYDFVKMKEDFSLVFPVFQYNVENNLLEVNAIRI